YRLFWYCKDTEAVHVKALTGNMYAEAKELTEAQAAKLINSLQVNWAVVDKYNQQHKYILSLLMQIGWRKQSDRYGTVADLNRLSDFLKSKKSPLNPHLKPLQDMDHKETSKLISCFESMLTKP